MNALATVIVTNCFIVYNDACVLFHKFVYIFEVFFAAFNVERNVQCRVAATTLLE